MPEKNTNDQMNETPKEDEVKAKASASKGDGSAGVGGIFEDKESYTKDEVTNGLQQVITGYEGQIKLIKDRLSATGSELAKAKGLEKQLELADEQIQALVKEAEERETAIAKGDAEALAVIQRGWGNRTQHLELAKNRRILEGERTQFNFEKEEFGRGRLKETAEGVAKEHGVDADLLISLVPEGGDRLTEVAKTLSQYTIGKAGQAGGNGEKGQQALQRGITMFRVSGKGSGGDETPTGREAVKGVIARAKRRAGVQT